MFMEGWKTIWRILLQELTLFVRIIAEQKVYYKSVRFHLMYVQKV